MANRRDTVNVIERLSHLCYCLEFKQLLTFAIPNNAAANIFVYKMLTIIYLFPKALSSTISVFFTIVSLNVVAVIILSWHV